MELKGGGGGNITTSEVVYVIQPAKTYEDESVMQSGHGPH